MLTSLMHRVKEVGRQGIFCVWLEARVLPSLRKRKPISLY